MLNLENERQKSLQDLLRDKQKILDYMRVTAQRLGIDTNKYKRTNEYKTKTINSDLLPVDFPLLIYKLLDIVDLYITVRKYSNETIQPTENEKEVITTLMELFKNISLNQ